MSREKQRLPEVPSLQDAAQAFADYREPMKNLGKESAPIMPDMENHEKYEKYAEQYLNVIEALEPVYKSDVYEIEG